MEKRPFSERIGRLLVLAAAVCLVIAVLCLVSPLLRRRSALANIGDHTVNELQAFSTALSYYSSNELTRLTAAPKPDQSYKQIAGLLAQVRQRNGYKSMYLLFRGQNRQYQYLIDADYRDNAKPGSDFYAPATAYPLDIYKSAVKQLDGIYSGKKTASYVTELVTRRDHVEVLCVYLPVYGPGNTVLAVLGIECDPGNTAYRQMGFVDLGVVAGLTLPLALIFAILALLLARRHRARAQQSAAWMAAPPKPHLPPPAAPPPPPADDTDPQGDGHE